MWFVRLTMALKTVGSAGTFNRNLGVQPINGFVWFDSLTTAIATAALNFGLLNRWWIMAIQRLPLFANTLLLSTHISLKGMEFWTLRKNAVIIVIVWLCQMSSIWLQTACGEPRKNSKQHAISTNCLGIYNIPIACGCNSLYHILLYAVNQRQTWTRCSFHRCRTYRRH